MFNILTRYRSDAHPTGVPLWGIFLYRRRRTTLRQAQGPRPLTPAYNIRPTRYAGYGHSTLCPYSLFYQELKVD